MTTLPITHMTLYKHGVGYFVRRAALSGESASLSFRVSEMNDILKSLTALDRGGGQVLGIDYETPQGREERLAGNSIRLDDDRSLRDLLAGLRGRSIRLFLKEGEPLAGILVGLDEPEAKKNMESAWVSVLDEDTDQVRTTPLETVTGVEILDPQGLKDLRFFLETALGQEQTRQVRIRLTDGEHDLEVRYIAPAPTWRVSYRLVLDDGEEEKRALLQGWGIFDNRLEEDLESISLSLVAGMPISFVYDLYTPTIPERPVVEDEARVAPGPVQFARGVPVRGRRRAKAGAVMEMAAMDSMPAPAQMTAADLVGSTQIVAEGQELGELFQYVIGTPVTVGRGQSAMVPILSATLGHRKDLLYNAAKLPDHPVATLRLKNETGLTLERGPITVLGDRDYLGEAVLAYTQVGSEFTVPYAVELGVRVQEDAGGRTETVSLAIREGFFQFEEWHIRWRDYQANNSTGELVQVLVEHPRTAQLELFDTPEPAEKTDGHYRFEVAVPEGGETTLRVQERRLHRRREELLSTSFRNMQVYLKQGLLDRRTHDRVLEILQLGEEIAALEKDLEMLNADREKIYKAQTQIQGNLGALGNTGAEAKMRAEYVTRLAGTETRLDELDRREASLQAEITAKKETHQARLEGLGKTDG